jgi:hypothetical protein
MHPDRIRRAGMALAVVLALLAAWAGRHEMTHDGVSYLDMSRAVLRGDWPRAINGHWSPLYPWLLALAFAVARPEPRWAFPLVHAVNVAIFLAALAAFDFFLRQVLVYRKTAVPEVGDGHAVPDAVIVTGGYLIFIWASLNLMGMAFVAPDLAVATCAFLAAGWMLRCRLAPGRWGPFAIMGVALGLGYLAKAPMFPIGFAFLALSVAPVPRGLSLRAAARRAAVALAVFLAVAGALVAGFYQTKGRLMLGDSAWLNYLWHVDRLPILHYQGEFRGYGTPLHPTRQISTAPAAYEFAGPIDATYPPWFDPAYWYAGLRPRFDLRGHLVTARWSLRLYDAEDALHHWMPGAVVFALTAAALASRRWLPAAGLRASLPVWGPGVAALATFASIHLESRYIAPFMVLWWLGLATGARIPPGAARRTAALLLAGVLVFHGGIVALMAARHAYRAVEPVAAPDRPSADPPWRVADALREMGIGPGERVAIVGPGIRAAYWAWLGGLRIIGEVPAWAKREFWQADDRVRQDILRHFAAAGARAVVNQPNFRAEGHEPVVDFEALGWKRVGDTGYYVLLLKHEPEPSAPACAGRARRGCRLPAD